MKYRPCFQCAIAALAAVGLCVFLHNEIAWILTAAGITLAAVFIWITGKKYRLNTVLCLLTALGCMGSFAHSYFSVYESALAQVGPVRDVVAQVEAPMSDSYKGNPRWAMRILSLNHESLKRPAVMLVEVELPDIDLHIGSTVRFYTDIRQSNRYATKDTTVRDLSYGIFLEGTMDASSMPQLLSDAKPSFAINMARQKQRLCTAADERLSSKAAQVFKGMLYGDKYNLEEDILLEFRYSGFAHLLAVSGLHIQVIFALIAALLSFPLRFCRRRNEIARMVSLAFVWGFILLIGCPVSAVRSGIMVFVSTVGVLVAKRSDTLNSLGVSVAAILLLMPFSICSLGFWMSVLATFGIGSAGMYFSRRWKSFTNQKLEQNRVRLQDWAREGVKLHPEQAVLIRRDMLKKRQRYAKRTALCSKMFRSFLPGVSATFGMLPIYLFWFGYLPLGSIVFGPLFSILFEGIMLLGVLFTVCVLCEFPAGIDICVNLLQPLLESAERMVSWVSSRQLLVLPLRREFAVVFCVFAAICVLFSHKVFCKKLFRIEKRIGIAIFLGLFFCLGLLFTQYYQYNIVEITAVGGYSSKDVVVVAKNRASVFLCHDAPDNERNMLAYLKRRGAWKIDHIYLMQPTVGIPEGALFLSNQMPVEKISYHADGMPMNHAMAPIASGDVPLSEAVEASFVYSGGGLNAAIRYGGNEVDILQDISLGVDGKGHLQPNGSSAVFLYQPIAVREEKPFVTDRLILLSNQYAPSAIQSGRIILFSEQTVTVEMDLQGHIHLP